MSDLMEGITRLQGLLRDAEHNLAAMTQRAESLEELLREIRGDAVIVSSRGSATYWPNRIDDLLKEGKE